MKHFFYLVYTVVSFSFFAQDSSEKNFLTGSNYLFKESQPAIFIFRDSSNLRVKPSTDSKIVNNLPIGSRVYLHSKSKHTLTLNGIKSAWYKVETQKGNGWIWGGCLAQQVQRSAANPDLYFLFSIKGCLIDSIDQRTEKVYQLKAVENNVELDCVTFTNNALYLGQLFNHNNAGLKNLDHLLTIDLPCIGGCGCTTGTKYFFFYNNAFKHTETLFGTADAEYSEYEEFIFPSDLSGEKFFVIKKSNFVDWSNEENINESDAIKRIYTQSYYIWNGESLVPSLSRKKTVENYKMDDF